MFLRRVILSANVFDIDRRRREGHLQRFQVLHDNPGHGEVPEPLVVGTDNKPRGMLGAAPGEGVFVSRRAVVPVGSLLVIGLADFPLLGGVVEPILEAFQLLLFGDVQVKLEDFGVVLDKSALESVDAIVTAGLYFLRDQMMNASDQDILVMGTVEDGRNTPGRRSTMNSPQEIMRKLLGGRLLEAHHFAALRIHCP